MRVGIPDLFLRAQLVGVSALLLAAVLCPRWQPSIALAADHLFAVKGLGKSSQRGVKHSPSQPKNEVESGLLLDIVVRQSPSILELLSREDESLLIRGDTLCAQASK